ncbi:hypothetical protein Agub_g12304 [Astrephomene gubernaculifera]|uniref:von Hippel-Lindau disease tumour suppressor beta domain-containing protein n=1 Tax=Astrephomene gubernaculifera TaxID=47775 RepID=A0AAD3DY33_9CHLO|nr:hypothetical protein Agub_g12304 [Astrephomene gubernaculifera]
MGEPAQAELSLPACSWTDASTGPSKLVVANRSGKSVQLVWLSYDGTEQVYNVLENGQDTQQDTYSTHVWELRDEEGGRIIQYAGPSVRIHVLPEGVSVVGQPAPPATLPSETF